MRDRVGEQVAKRLSETVGIGEQRARRQRVELEATVSERGDALPKIVDEGLEVDRLDAQEMVLFCLGEQQQVIYQAARAGYLCLDEPLYAA